MKKPYESNMSPVRTSLREAVVKILDKARTRKESQGVTVLKILASIEQLGYPKLEGEPPLLSDEDLLKFAYIHFISGSYQGTEQRLEALAYFIAQAQREVDIKFYTD